jgi:hypothetical protein
VKRAVIVALFAFGYPVAIAVIVRYVPVVRERRIRWFAAHEAAVSAIVAGHALRPDAPGVVINGAWLVAGTAWYALGGRRQRSPS